MWQLLDPLSDIAERAILGVILAGRFWSIQAVFVAKEPFCDVVTPSWALINLLRVIYWK